MASICQIRVLSSGKYCCQPQHLTVRPCCVGEVSFTNLPPTTVEVETTPDNWTAADPASIEGDGCVKLYKPGTYRFGVDCEALNGTLAPEEGAIGLCYDTTCYTKAEYLDLLNLQTLECLKESVQDLNLEIDLSDIVTAIDALCDKVEQLPTVGTDLTSFGCIQDEEGNEVGVVLACKKADASGNVIGIELWGLISGQAPIQNYTGEWKPCTSRTNELLQELVDKTCKIDEFLESVKTTCGEAGIPDADYTSGSAWVTGRPNTTALWELIDNRDPANQVVVASGANFNAFVADLESKGYTEWSFGETHYICPCPPGLVNAGDYFTQADGETVTKMSCTPSAELPEFPDKLAPEEQCAIAMKDCNSDQMLEKMCEILGDPSADCPECEESAKESVTYTNSDNETELVVSVGGDGDIKIDAGSGDGSEAEVVACIESCLAAGDEVVVTWTTVDGGSGSATLLPGALTNAFPAFYNQSTDAQGDSGKLLTLTCE